MKVIAIAAAVLTLAGCETMRTVAPHTTAGFEAGGVLGAMDGASGAVLVRCRTLDGQVLRVAIDDMALGTGTTDTVEDIRVRRQQACAVIGAVQVVAVESATPAASVMGVDAGIGQGYGPGQASAVLPEG